MDHLPDVPFEKVLTFLGLKELLKARVVSKEFRRKIDNFRVRSLCFSDWERDYIVDKNRLIVGKFAQNFISSSKFESFFAYYGRSVLNRLKYLRVCDLDMEGKTLELIVNSFENLESLAFVRVKLEVDFKLILAKLRSIYVEWATDHITLTLDAPRLSEIEIFFALSRLNIVHPESVETVVIHHDYNLDLESLKNLKFLYCTSFADNASDTLLSSLGQLKVIQFEMEYDDSLGLKELHDQKQRYGRSELKIYYRGLCLASPDDYPEFLDDNLSSEALRCITANYSRLAEQLPNNTIEFDNDAIQRVPADFWSRLTNLREIEINEPVGNVEQFLNLLKNCPSFRGLFFSQAQSQDLFSQLSTHCLSANIQRLGLRGHDLNLDFSFLFKFEYLIDLCADPFRVNWIPRIFKELKFFRTISFVCEGIDGYLEINRWKRIHLRIFEPGEDVDEAVRTIIESEMGFRELNDIDEAVQIIAELEKRINNNQQPV